MEKLTNDEIEALKAEALSRYPIGCRINQRNAYNGNGSEWKILNTRVRAKTVNNPTEYYVNITVNGVGVYKSSIGIWAEIISSPQEYVLI